ncbi:MAG: hypothetical protein ABSG01_13525 [Anaerolineales bacterium]|jgi:hypothetical protein
MSPTLLLSHKQMWSKAQEKKLTDLRQKVAQMQALHDRLLLEYPGVAQIHLEVKIEFAIRNVASLEMQKLESGNPTQH